VLRRLILVAFFLEVGLLLIVLPWSSFWERNYFAATWPAVRALVTNNFVRGAVSGLGVVNVIAGFSELMPMFGARRERHDLSLTHRPATDSRYAGHPDTQVDR
jgi:hypothetical protein